MYTIEGYSVVDEIKDDGKYYYLIQNKYGICKVLKSEWNRGKLPSIKSSLKPTQYFQNQSNEIHNNKYTVLSDYKSSKDKITLSCPEHGEFSQIPANHLKGQACPNCSKKLGALNRTDSFEVIKSKANIIHNNCYTYLLLTDSKLHIKCSDHGIFIQNKNDHLQGSGCPSCSYIKNSYTQRLSQQAFEEKANNMHGFKYNYCNFQYINSTTIGSIECSIHGSFTQRAANHLQGQGCPSCSKENRSNHNDPDNWQVLAEKSKYFDSFKVYILKCWSEDNHEEFIKIGKTYRKIKSRYPSKREMPYNYTIIRELIFNNSVDCCNYEQLLHIQFKQNQIIPSISFGGKFECYSLSILPTVLK